MLHDIIAVEAEIRRLDISQSTICALTEIPAGSLSDILRGLKKPSFEQERDIYRWLEGLNKLIDAVKPLQLDLRKTLQLKEQILLHEAGRLQIQIVIQEARPVDEPYYFVFLQYNYFRARRKNPLGKFEIISASGTGTAVAMVLGVAEQLQEALSRAGIKASVVPGANISEDAPVYDCFEDVWGDSEEIPPAKGPSDPAQLRMMRMNHNRKF